MPQRLRIRTLTSAPSTPSGFDVVFLFFSATRRLGVENIFCLAGFGGVLPHALGLRPPSGESTQMSQILFHRRDAEPPRKNQKHKLSGTSAAGALPEFERRGSRDRRDVLSPCHNVFASGPH